MGVIKTWLTLFFFIFIVCGWIKILAFFASDLDYAKDMI